MLINKTVRINSFNSCTHYIQEVVLQPCLVSYCLVVHICAHGTGRVIMTSLMRQTLRVHGDLDPNSVGVGEG